MTELEAVTHSEMEAAMGDSPDHKEKLIVSSFSDFYP
jgi:hypothetical protein